MRARPSTAPTKRRNDASQGNSRFVIPKPSRVGVNTTNLEVSAKKSMNSCPICKMPLYIGDTTRSDALWRQTQYWFKGKPSFVLDDIGARNRNAFGPAHGIGIRNPNKNANACHFVHVSASEGQTTFHGLWDKFADPRGVDKKFNLCPFLNETQMKDNRFSERLNITYSVFADLEPTHGDHAVDSFLWDVINTAQVTRAVGIISKGTFAGCWDCNHKMTQMKLIHELYSVSFGDTEDIARMFTHTPAVNADQRQELMLNAEMYYILMQGMLKRDNVFVPVRAPGGPAVIYKDLRMQQVNITPDQQCKWQFKLAILWCLLMILLSNWNISDQKVSTRHLMVYIYAGTSDFYLSLVCYLIYIANFRHATRDPLSFEEFHYFYATNFVFHMKRKGMLVEDPLTPLSNSLTAAIMHPLAFTQASWPSANLGNDMQQKRPSHLYDGAREDIATLYRGIVKFSDNYLKKLCNHLYDDRMDATTFDEYLSSLENIQVIDNHISRIPGTTIQEFVDYLGDSMYWYHFKNITMPQIAHDVKLARDTVEEERQRVIDNWYNHTSASVRQLRGPMPTSSGRALVRLSAQFAAALRLRASSGASSSCRS